MADQGKSRYSKADAFRAAGAKMGFSQFGKPGPTSNPRPPIGETGKGRTFSAGLGGAIGTALAVGAATAVGSRIANAAIDRAAARRRSGRAAGGKGGGRGGAGRG